MSGELGLRQYLKSQGHTLVVTSDKNRDGSEFDQHLADADVVISRPFWPAYLTAERIARASKLKLALTAGIGSDHVAESIADPGGDPILTPANEPEIQRLRAESSATLYYTGVSLNLLTLRPEICLLLLIEDPDWLDREHRTAQDLSLTAGGRPMVYGWEIVQRERDMPAGRSLARFLSLDDDLRPSGDHNAPLQPELLVPNAAAAISLALRVVRSTK